MEGRTEASFNGGLPPVQPFRKGRKKFRPKERMPSSAVARQQRREREARELDQDADCEECMVNVCALCCLCLSEPRGWIVVLLILSALWNLTSFHIFTSPPRLYRGQLTTRGGLYSSYTWAPGDDAVSMHPHALVTPSSRDLPEPIIVKGVGMGNNKDFMRCLNLDALWRSDRKRSRHDKTADEQLLWDTLGCEKHIKSIGSHGGMGGGGEGGRGDDEVKEWCTSTEHKYNVRPGVSWGFLPMSMQDRWQRNKCDCYTNIGCDTKIEAHYARQHSGAVVLPRSILPGGIWASVEARPEIERLGFGSMTSSVNSSRGHSAGWGDGGGGGTGTRAGGDPIVAILVPSTSRSFRWTQLLDSPVVRFLIPSIFETIDKGEIYRVYVGYDVGDLFYDDEKNLARLRGWLKTHLTEASAKEGITAEAAVVGFYNELKKPGPMFNYLSACAVADGADYIYRINDDTEFATRFAGQLIKALSSLSPPNIGAVGPTCKEGNKDIMTHDFVHWSHIAIHKLHYPPVLMDWWMDDWISSVYGPSRTKRLRNVLVVHHIAETSRNLHPVRYIVDYSHKPYLGSELIKGQRMIHEYIDSKCGGDSGGSSMGVSSKPCTAPPFGVFIDKIIAEGNVSLAELKPSEGYDSDDTGLASLKSDGGDDQDDDVRIKKIVRDVPRQFVDAFHSNAFDPATKNMDGARLGAAWGGEQGGLPPPSKAEAHNLDDSEPFEVGGGGGGGGGDAHRGNSVGRG